MIIAHIIGGLGNQMFQYALAKHLSIKNNDEILLDLSSFKTYKLHAFALSHLNIKIKSASPKICLKQKYGTSSRKLVAVYNFLNKFMLKATGKVVLRKKGYILEPKLSFTQEILNSKGDIYLEGYWQSEKYFLEIRDILLKEFSPKEEASGDNKKLLDKIDSLNSVSLHVRRGDYVKDSTTNDLHGCCSIDYYKKAVELIKNKVNSPHFFIFSDDPEWARTNLSCLGKATVVDINDVSTNYEDVRLMSRCKHNIVANSSFSWWGAWLNQSPDKIVITPSRWFKSNQIDTSDLIPDGWKKLENDF